MLWHEWDAVSEPIVRAWMIDADRWKSVSRCLGKRSC